MMSSELYIVLVNLWNVMRSWHISRVLEWRRKELRRMDRDIFFKFHKWPRYMRRIYFQNAFPHGDAQTFQLMPFLVGNGLSFYRAAKWVLSSHVLVKLERRDRLARRRIAQIKWIRQHFDQRLNHWRYFDIDERRIVYLIGSIYNQHGQ